MRFEFLGSPGQNGDGSTAGWAEHALQRQPALEEALRQSLGNDQEIPVTAFRRLVTGPRPKEHHGNESVSQPSMKV